MKISEVLLNEMYRGNPQNEYEKHSHQLTTVSDAQLSGYTPISTENTVLTKVIVKDGQSFPLYYYALGGGGTVNSTIRGIYVVMTGKDLKQISPRDKNLQEDRKYVVAELSFRELANRSNYTRVAPVMNIQSVKQHFIHIQSVSSYEVLIENRIVYNVYFYLINSGMVIVSDNTHHYPGERLWDSFISYASRNSDGSPAPHFNKDIVDSNGVPVNTHSPYMALLLTPYGIVGRDPANTGGHIMPKPVRRVIDKDGNLSDKINFKDEWRYQDPLRPMGKAEDTKAVERYQQFNSADNLMIFGRTDLLSRIVAENDKILMKYQQAVGIVDPKRRQRRNTERRQAYANRTPEKIEADRQRDKMRRQAKKNGTPAGMDNSTVDNKSVNEESKYLGPTIKVKINKKGWQVPLNKKGFGV